MSSKKVILCGYHWTGCEALRILLLRGYEVYVYTHKPTHDIPDLIEYCIKNSINYTTEKISKDNLPFKPDFITSVYYRYIILEDVINYVDGNIFNLHPSYLPDYRGCSSLTWAMINGEKFVGFSYHYIDKGCDTGNIILQKIVFITDFDTQLTLFQRVMFESMKHYEEAIELVFSGYKGVRQTGKGSYYGRGAPFNGVINLDWNDEKKELFIRAMKNPPLPYASYKNNEIYSLSDLKRVVK